jgi:hypothetical protein
MPGIVVLTRSLRRMKRSASSASVMPAGSARRSASTRASVARSASGVKYPLRQSSSGQVLSARRAPVSDPSSKGTRAMTATSCSSQTPNSSSSALWSNTL